MPREKITCFFGVKNGEVVGKILEAREAVLKVFVGMIVCLVPTGVVGTEGCIYVVSGAIAVTLDTAAIVAILLLLACTSPAVFLCTATRESELHDQINL